MKDVEVIKSLKKLTKSELKNFEKFISSPYSKIGRNLLPYFRELKKFYPTFDSKNLTKQNLFKKLHPDKEFGHEADLLINKLNSDLTKLFKEFIINNELSNNDYIRGLLLAQGLIKKELFEKSLDVVSNNQKKLQQDGVDIDFFWQTYKLTNLKAYAFQGLRRVSEYHSLPKELSLLNLMNTFVAYFNEAIMVKMLSNETKVNLNDLIFNKSLKLLDFMEVSENVRRLNPKYASVFDVYYSMYKSYYNPLNRKLFKRFKNTVFKNLQLFSRSERHYLLIGIINQCKMTEKMGIRDRTHDAYEACIEMIKHNAYSYVEDHIDSATFDYIVNYILKMKKYGQAERFIKNFSEKLPANNRDYFVNLAMIRLYFEKKDYTEGLKYISKAPKDDVYEVSIKHYTIQYYYELGYFNQLQDVIDSFLKLLKVSSKISDLNIKRFKNFSRTVLFLVKARLGKNVEKSIFKAKQIIDKYPETFGTEWLTEKISELEKSETK
ncbi:MAG: hypothetical protein N2510_06165 [Ignavibacteria bacterium]|nr:hypothetical protein [Ignavibacteria bacterium]